MDQKSPLEQKRLAYQPPVPDTLAYIDRVRLQELPFSGKKDPALQKLFPNTWRSPSYEIVSGQPTARALHIGAVFSGGPAAGGHNVLAGLYDALHALSPSSRLIGFLNGPAGIVEDQFRQLSATDIDCVRNLGGFDLIGSGRGKIETAQQLEKALESCLRHKLDGLVVIGGDDSNTNAAVLAEFFLAKKCPTAVIGVPKTIDGDLRSRDIEISFGFDSACRTYSELIGNIARDAKSSGKYYHFIKLMGRSASNITLECALATQPNLALIGEEGLSLELIVEQIADLIERRWHLGKEYGVILVPEGLVEFVPEIKALIEELNAILSLGQSSDPRGRLSSKNRAFLSTLPETVQEQFLLERDPHGNVTVSQIETEQLLMALVKKKLKERDIFKGKFTAQEHFFGYEGRCCLPSNFDAHYCYALGRLAALGVRDGATGTICSIQGLKGSVKQWTPKMTPIVPMMHLELRKGKEKPVIQKSLVDIKGDLAVHFFQKRKNWELEDLYRYPGPIQFFGGSAITDQAPLILGI